MAHRKPNLPEKTCAACARSFAWRKKWARDWDQVRFCSDACRTGRYAAATRLADNAAETRCPKDPIGTEKAGGRLDRPLPGR